MLGGSRSDERLVSENAFDSTRPNDDGDSNEIDESDPQDEKQPAPRISTELGIKICFNELDQKHAFDSICLNDDGDSNEIDESEKQHKRQLEPRISTELGIKICSSGSHGERPVDSIDESEPLDEKQLERKTHGNIAGLRQTNSVSPSSMRITPCPHEMSWTSPV